MSLRDIALFTGYAWLALLVASLVAMLAVMVLDQLEERKRQRKRRRPGGVGIPPARPITRLRPYERRAWGDYFDTPELRRQRFKMIAGGRSN